MMIHRTGAGLATFMLALAPSGTSKAHAVLEQAEATIGASYKAVVKIGHGCQGSPTIAVTVKVPEGIIAVKPMPKPGWSVSAIRGRYAKSYDFYHGVKLEEGVVEVTWSAGRLLDEHYDEFVLSGFVAESLEPGLILYWTVDQVCETGAHSWTEVPGAGQSAHDLKSPAPALRLKARAGGGHH